MGCGGGKRNANTTSLLFSRAPHRKNPPLACGVRHCGAVFFFAQRFSPFFLAFVLFFFEFFLDLFGLR
jgi:phosphatidylglycerophosphate synthase